MKQLTVTIQVVDTDKSPKVYGWQVNIGSKAPQSTAGRIIQQIEEVAKNEGCSMGPFESLATEPK